MFPSCWARGAAAVTYTFTNNSTTPSDILMLGGGISGGTTLTTVLTLTGSNTGNNAINGNISNGSSSSLGITKTGTGLWILGGLNTYTGLTTVTTGTLRAGSTQAFGNNAAVTGSSAGVLDLAGYNNSIGSITSTGNLLVNIGTATLTMGGDNTSPAAFTGSLLGTSGVVNKIGTGTITLSGTSTFGGGLNIQQGTIKTTQGTNVFIVGNNGALGTGAVSFGGTGTSGTLDISASIAPVVGINMGSGANAEEYSCQVLTKVIKPVQFSQKFITSFPAKAYFPAVTPSQHL